MLEQELHFEKDIFLLLNGSEHVFLDNFFYLYSYKFTWIPFYLCFLFIFIYKRNWKEILCVVLAIALVILLCDQISSGFFKPFFERFRPTHHPDFQNSVSIVYGYRGGKYGFISSHAANAFGFAVFTALLFRNRWFTLMIVLFALLNGYSRIYLGVHFISDIVAGSLLGVIVGIGVYELFNLVRLKWINVPKDNLKKAIYPAWESYFLCIIYITIVVFLLIFNSQFVNYLISFK